MKVKPLHVAGAAVVIAAAAAVWAGTGQPGLSRFLPPAEAAVSPAPAALAEIGVIEAVARPVSEYEEFTGRFVAANEVAIQARVSGQLEAIHFRSGQVVRKGDLLFTIDPRPFATTLAEAEARLTEARAALRLAESDLVRQQTLMERGHAAQSALDTVRQRAEAARAAIGGAEAAVKRAWLDLEFTRIHAPISGRISDDAVSVGNLITAGASSQPLTTIVSIDPIHFEFDATERQFLNYQRQAANGDARAETRSKAVSVKLVDEDSFDHDGVIDFLDNALDRSSGTIRGRAVIPNPNGSLTPGMFGRLRMTLAKDVDRILVPDQAIGSDQAEKFVWIVTGEGRVERRQVRLGALRDGLRIVTGVAEGEQVAVENLHMIAPGAEVATRLVDNTRQTAGLR